MTDRGGRAPRFGLTVVLLLPLLLAALPFPGLVHLPRAGAAPAPPAAPVLYYTTNAPPALKTAPYSVAGGKLRVGTSTVLAKLPAADGLAAAPDGDLLVGGGSTGSVFKINPKSGAVVAVASGIPTAFHVTVSPDGATAWTAGLPGQLARVPLKPFGAGTAVAVKGDDVAVSTIGFAPSGAFYTSSTSFGTGNFGTFDVATATTKRTLTELRGAHGFAYDPFSKTIFLFGSYAIVQVSPAHPTEVLSQKFVPDMAFDQGVVDGQGHLLAASNTGNLAYVSYAGTGTVGPKSLGSIAFLDTNLDDLITPNPPTISEAVVSSGSSGKKKLLLLLVGVIGVGGIGFVVIRRRNH